MKETDFRALRREEKRKAYAMKRARLEAARAQRLAEQQRSAVSSAERRKGQKESEEEPRVPDTFVGRFEFVRRGGIVFCDSKYLHDNIIIPADHMHDAVEGDKVVVRLFHRGSKRHMPEGEVLAILGRDGENDAEMNAILAEYGLPYDYPEVEGVAELRSEGVTDAEILRRRDMRDVLTFTIDPTTAKDYDDALSFVRLPEGGYEIGVHIADVTHYVRPGTALDEEAYRRGTSVYLVDRTVPMLPEVLSNELCSLRPEEDKLTYSVVFHMDDTANVLKYKICQTVIRSNYRLTYDQAQEMLEHPEGGSEELVEALRTLNELAKKLRERRMAAGAVDIDSDEVCFDLDENGHPTAVRLRPHVDSNDLIEEFMLLANRTVATHVGKDLHKPFVYRVHDKPDPEKMEKLKEFVKTFAGTHPEPLTLSSLVNQLTVRAMAKAVYSPDNIGHYGLAFPFYTHFTSPIRRYPDIMVHRLLKHYLGKEASPDLSMLETWCKHCSGREQLAASAERASIKYKQVEFMQDQLGREFDGVVCGVTEWGLYVELTETHCEGLVPIRNLVPQDYYDCIESEFCLRGRIHDRIFRLGDTLRVRVERADLSRKQLDFALVK